MFHAMNGGHKSSSSPPASSAVHASARSMPQTIDLRALRNWPSSLYGPVLKRSGKGRWAEKEDFDTHRLFYSTFLFRNKIIWVWRSRHCNQRLDKRSAPSVLVSADGKCFRVDLWLQPLRRRSPLMNHWWPHSVYVLVSLDVEGIYWHLRRLRKKKHETHL